MLFLKKKGKHQTPLPCNSTDMSSLTATKLMEANIADNTFDLAIS